MKIMILPKNSLGFLDNIKDKKSIVSYSKIIDKINNNDIMKYPANKDVINFYIVVELLVKLQEHEVVYIIPNDNIKSVFTGVINLLKTQRINEIAEVFCINRDVMSNYMVYNTMIFGQKKCVLEYNEKIIRTEEDFEIIKNHIGNNNLLEIGQYCYMENKVAYESTLFSY